MYPEHINYGKKIKESSSILETKNDSYQETTPEDMKLYKSIRKASDRVSLFSDTQLSSMTLEQKMLAGFF